MRAHIGDKGCGEQENKPIPIEWLTSQEVGKGLLHN